MADSSAMQASNHGVPAWSASPDWSTFIRKTGGADAPPPLVGCSVTVVGDQILVFGGRLADSRQLCDTLYALDLRNPSFPTWEQLSPPSMGERSAASPSPRYFHSAEAWNGKLVIWGGQTLVTQAEEVPDSEAPLVPLDELYIYDVAEKVWSHPTPTSRPGVAAPEARYAHTSALAASLPPFSVVNPFFPSEATTAKTSSYMAIIGGQNARNEYIKSVHVLDLDRSEWVAQTPYTRKSGSYRSLAAGSPLQSTVPVSPASSADGGPGTPGSEAGSRLSPVASFCCYQNGNFDAPHRFLDNFTITSDSSNVGLSTAPVYMSPHPALPDGIRFPVGGTCGQHLIVSGISLKPYGRFVIWALDLEPSGGSHMKAWRELPMPAEFSEGNWSQAVIGGNKLVVLGARDRDIVADYHQRQNNFSHITFLDLESFGIYEPPTEPIPPALQALGIAALEEPGLCDFDILTSSGCRLPCSRRLLEERWPWFRQELALFEVRTRSIKEAADSRQKGTSDSPSVTETGSTTSSTTEPSCSKMRFTPRLLELPLSYEASLAFVQFLYTLALGTDLQNRWYVLCELLSFCRQEELVPELRRLVVHRLHKKLGGKEAYAVAGEIYEAATLANCPALQIRSLQVLLAAPAVSPTPRKMLTPSTSLASLNDDMTKPPVRKRASDANLQAVTSPPGSPPSPNASPASLRVPSELPSPTESVGRVPRNRSVSDHNPRLGSKDPRRRLSVAPPLPTRSNTPFGKVSSSVRRFMGGQKAKFDLADSDYDILDDFEALGLVMDRRPSLTPSDLDTRPAWTQGPDVPRASPPLCSLPPRTSSQQQIHSHRPSFSSSVFPTTPSTYARESWDTPGVPPSSPPSPPVSRLPRVVSRPQMANESSLASIQSSSSLQGTIEDSQQVRSRSRSVPVKSDLEAVQAHYLNFKTINQKNSLVSLV